MFLTKANVIKRKNSWTNLIVPFFPYTYKSVNMKNRLNRNKKDKLYTSIISTKLRSGVLSTPVTTVPTPIITASIIATAIVATPIIATASITASAAALNHLLFFRAMLVSTS